jgi:hypothetical protein
MATFNFDDPRLAFDDKDFHVDEAELAQYLDGSAADDDHLLRELEGLADASTLSPVVQGNFGMIRTAPDAADYNIDHVTLTAEDENDPALLAELDKMLRVNTEDHEQTTDAVEAEPEAETHNEPTSIEELEAELESPEDNRLPLEVRLQTKDRDLLLKYIHLEKVRTVACKRAGDQAGMSESFKAYKQLQARLQEIDNSDGSEDMLGRLKADALRAKREGNMEQARELMAKVMQLEKAKGTAVAKPADNRAKAKDLLAKLSNQIDESYEAVKFYIKSGDKNDAGLALGRKKAFESDLMAIKAAALANGALPKGRTVSMQIPISLELEELPEGEMHVVLSGIKASPKDTRKRSKEFFDSRDDHFLKAVFEWPPDAAEAEHQKLGSLFKPGKSVTVTDRFAFGGVKRDIKGQKFFEYQKLKVELYRKESSFLFKTKSVLVASNQVRLAPLLNQVQLTESVELMDATRRSIGITVDVSLRIQKPISGKAFKFKPVQWIVFDELSSGRLFPDPTAAKVPSASASKSLGASQTLANDETGDKELAKVEKEVASMVSYALIEHELSQLANNPAVLDDPLLAARQIALEGRRDAIALQIELGQLSMEAYLEAVKNAITEGKKAALEAKRAGNIDRARMIMARIQLMEQEVASAEDGGEDGE